MLIDEKIEIKISAPTINYYKKLGYLNKINDIIIIPIEHLPKKSNKKIKIRCDFCNNSKMELYIAYNRYIDNSQDGKYRCKICSLKFKKEELMEKFGVSNYSQLNHIKEKEKLLNCNICNI